MQGRASRCKVHFHMSDDVQVLKRKAGERIYIRQPPDIAGNEASDKSLLDEMRFDLGQNKLG